MYVKRRNTVSYHGYTKELLFSAIQKYIRRGLYQKAVWCALEVDRFRNLLRPDVMQVYLAAHGDRNEKDTRTQIKGMQTNLINRFKVISVEDVGIGQPGLCSIIDTLIIIWEESNREHAEPLMKIVYLLCHAQKLRMLSDVKSVYHLPPYYGANPAEEKRIAGFIPILRELYNIPSETGRETMKTKDLSVFYWISRNVNDLLDPKHPIWLFLFQARPTMQTELHCLQKWSAQKIRESVLFLYQAVLLTILPPSLIATPMDLRQMANAVSFETYESLICTRLTAIDTYCNDKHVARSGETSVTRFALEGALCANEAVALIIPGYRQLYIHLKRAIDAKRDLTPAELIALERPAIQPVRRPAIQPVRRPAIQPVMDTKKETDYLFVVRAQVTTGISKADAYFASDPQTGEFLLIKGPLQSAEYGMNAISMNLWKRDNQLPYMPSLSLVNLIPDRWSAGTALGYRNKIDRSKPAPFLLAESTVKEDLIRSHITTYGDYMKAKVGKTWPLETEIVDWSVIKSHIDVDALNPLEMQDYVLLLLARYVFGISDLADRNFLRKNGRVFSIDEEYSGKPVNFFGELKTKKCHTIHIWLETHYGEIYEIVKKWNIPDAYAVKYKEVLIDLIKYEQAKYVPIDTPDLFPKAPPPKEKLPGKKKKASEEVDGDKPLKKLTNPLT